MRSFVIVLFSLLVACNGSNSPPDVADVSAAQLQALQAQVDGLNAQVKQLQLIGRPVGNPVAKTDQIETFRMLGEPTLAPAASSVAAPGQFGTCPNMGVQDGFNSASGDVLSASSKAFKTCTGYHVEYNTADGSVKVAPRVFWDGPNCTGNMYEWEAGGAGYDTETLQDGVVFVNPINPTSTLMVSAHQTPQLIQYQSVIVTSNPTCQSDIEAQLIYKVTLNITQITGVPSSAIGFFTTGSP